MIPTVDAVDAQRAADIGLVNRVVPHDSLLGEAFELAERITRHPAASVAACLAAVTRGINVPIDEGLAIEAAWFATAVPGQAVHDGLDRFLTRRNGPTRP